MAQTILTLDELRAHDPEGGRRGRWLCPLPACQGHTNPRRHRSLSLDDASGLWKCQRCGAGGQIRDKWKPMEPRRSWEDRKADARRERERRRAAALAIFTSAPTPEPSGALSAFRLGSLRPLEGTPGGAYLAGRGIGAELAHAAGVRFAVDFGRRGAEEGKSAWSGAAAVVFPIRGKGGKLVAAQGRFIAPREGGPKMMTLGPKSTGIFATPGALDTPGPVAVVEAPIDALSLAAAGLPALALCGTSGAPAWLLDLLAWRPVLLAFDADAAGDAAAAAFGAELARVSLGMANPRRLRPVGAKDWNELLNTAPDSLRAQVGNVMPKAPAFATGRPVAPMPSEAPRSPVEAPHPALGTDDPSEPVADARAGEGAGIGASVDLEELRGDERAEALLLSAWRDLWAGRLPVEPFQLWRGPVCTRPDRWLLSAVKRRAYLLREFGPAWWDTEAGQILAVDLHTFAGWYAGTGEGEGQPAPAPPWPKPTPMAWAPRWDTRPDPAAVDLDSAAPWPDGPADTPERVAAWSERVALFMQAQGRHPADVAELVAAYGIGAELRTPARA